MAARPSLRVGDTLQLDGTIATVAAINGNAVIVHDKSEGLQRWHLPQLLRAAKFDTSDKSRLHRVRSIAASTDPRLEKAIKLEAHVIEATTGQQLGEGCMRSEYDPARTTQAERDRRKIRELASQGVEMSLRTWERLRAAYRDRGLDGLVDQRAFRSNGMVRTDPRIIDELVASLHELANDSTRTKQWVINRVKRKLLDRFGDQAPRMPSKATMYRLIDVVEKGSSAFGEAKTRRSVASRPKGMFRHTQGYRPGERVEIDSTRADMLVIAPGGREIRPELTVAVDTATRTICAAVLNTSTNSTDLSLLLAEIVAPVRTHPQWEEDLAGFYRMVPETYRFASWEDRKDAHREHPIIVPETIVADIGPPYRSRHFRRACEVLGISVESARPGTPTDKPTVERLIQTINRQFCQDLPGYTGHNVAHRGRRVEAVLTLEQAQDLLDEWVASVWQNRPHQGLMTIWDGRDLSPNRMYSHFVAHTGVLKLPFSFDDYVELLPIKWVAVHHYGINHDRRVYDGPLLNDLRHCRNPDPTSGGKWELHYNPNNVFHAWLRGPHGWIQVDWVHRHLFTAPFGARLWAKAKKTTPGQDEETVARAALRLQQDLIEQSSSALRSVVANGADAVVADEVDDKEDYRGDLAMVNFDPEQWPE